MYCIALIVLVKAECTGIELLVDGIPFNNDMLYKPLGSSGTFVGCRECSTGVTPSWFKSDAKISSCGDGGNRSMICVDSRNNNIDLQFLFFLHSHRGSYTCSKYGDHKTLTIDVLDSPTITIHPTSLLTASGVSGTLNCEGAGKGLVMYQWETSNVNGGPWMKIGDSKRLVVRSFEQPRQYRCMVTNEAGTVRSSIATVTTLSKLLFRYFSRGA